MIESWRKQKLKEAKKLIRGKRSNTTILREEAGMILIPVILYRILRICICFENCFSIICLAGAVSIALGSDWSELSEEIGLWIPVEIVNKEEVGNPESEELGNYLLDCRSLVLFIFVSFNINELVSGSISEKLTSL